MSAVTIKSAQELEYMREAGRILASVHQTLGDALCEGMSTLEIDTLGEEIIRSFGCRAFLFELYGISGICVCFCQ